MRKAGLSIPFSVYLLSALVRVQSRSSFLPVEKCWQNVRKMRGQSLAAGVRARALPLGGHLQLGLQAGLWGREGIFPRSRELGMWERGRAGACGGPLLLSCNFPWPLCRFWSLPLQASEITAVLWLFPA